MAIVIWALTITINIYATGASALLGNSNITDQIILAVMIVSRILLVNKRTATLSVRSSSGKNVHLQFVVRIVVESALLYTGTSIFAFVALVLGNNLGYIATEIVSHNVKGDAVGG